jgi:N-acetyl sugar amidotransferase
MGYDPATRKAQAIFGQSRRDYRICSRCVMDTSDPEIEFDDLGVCNHCHAYDKAVLELVYKGEHGRNKLAAAVAQIKEEGKRKRYDCIVGLSGGVDSSYVAYLVKQLGLRPLAVHLDNGWNSEVAVRNIESIVKLLGLDLYTEVLDWEEFRRLQLAFLRASTPDSEIPTDHAIVATLYRLAMQYGVRWLIEGSNVVTESMVPPTWSHGHSDWRYIKHLNDTFGGTSLASYPHYTYVDLQLRFRFLKLRRFPILNYIDFKKDEAVKVLQTELGWVPYGKKHYESIYTRFYQGCILPAKFGFDKRRPHISCLINNGEITREGALAELEHPAIPPDQLVEDRAFVLKKLGLTDHEFEAILALPRKMFWDYPSYEVDLRRSVAWKVYCRVRGLLILARYVTRKALFLGKGYLLRVRYGN